MQLSPAPLPRQSCGTALARMPPEIKRFPNDTMSSRYAAGVPSGGIQASTKGMGLGGEWFGPKHERTLDKSLSCGRLASIRNDGAGAKSVYFGDRPMWPSKGLQRRRPFIENMRLSHQGKQPEPPLDSASRASLASSTSETRATSPTHVSHAGAANEMSKSTIGLTSPSATRTFACHGFVFSDQSLQALPSLQRANSSPGHLSQTLRASRQRNELYAGNVYKGSRHILIGM